MGADAVRVIDGRRCRTKDALFGEWSGALDLPSPPHTWDDFGDCLRHWPELGSRVLVQELDAHDMLGDASEADRSAFWQGFWGIDQDRPLAHIRFLFHVPPDARRVPSMLTALPEVRV